MTLISSKAEEIAEDIQRLRTGGIGIAPVPAINIVNESIKKVATASEGLKLFMIEHKFDNNETLVSILDLLHVSLDILSKAKV